MLLLVLLEGAPTDSRVRLAIFLRYAAGGMTLDLEEIYHVSRGECYRSTWRVVDAINGPGGSPLCLFLPFFQVGSPLAPT